MSSTLAIAASTLALRNRVQAALDRDGLNAVVTARPPDRARGNQTGNQLNLFLYELALGAAWRNAATPRQLPGGEGAALAPLGLSARYLLTAYAQDDEDELGHRLLGSAMLSLHDQALLTPAELRAALPASDLADQREHVRVTPHPLSLDELSKLWATFQTPYRSTVAYEVSVLLIDTRQPEHVPLPVLRRPLPTVSAGPSPTLLDVRPPLPLPAVRPGEALTWQLEHAPALNATPHLRPLGGQDLVALPNLTRAETGEPFRLEVPPDAPWPVGAYQAWLTLRGEDGDADTLPVTFTLAPAITLSPQTAPAGPLSLTVACAPAVRPGQPVRLLIGGLLLPPASRAPDGLHLTFDVPALPPGRYTARLRVGEVDSLPVRLVGAAHPYQPEFDPAQQLELT